MNRRSLLKLLPAAVTGIALSSTVRTASSAPSRDSARLNTVRRMIAETPAQGWASRYGHGSTLVYFGDGQAFEVSFRNNRPTILERPLTSSERGDLKRYQQKLDPHVPQTIGTPVGNGKWRIRGWIHNGRHSDGWIMSVEQT